MSASRDADDASCSSGTVDDGKPVPYKSIRKCIITGCESNSKVSPQLSFFRLPGDEDRKKIWLQRMQGKTRPSKSKYVALCEKHFENKYIKVFYWRGPIDRKNLTAEAVPTVFPTLYYPELDVALESHTSPEHASEPSTKQHLQKQKYTERSEPDTIRDKPELSTVFINDDDEEESCDEEDFIIDGEFLPQFDYLDMDKKKKPKGLIFSAEFKLLALQLFFKCPISYRLFHSALSLPRVSTLYRLCIPNTTALSQELLSALKLKVDSMSSTQRQCVVCIGTLSLTPSIRYDDKSGNITGFHELNNACHIIEPARYALVVMVRGLFHNWKQALTFGFLLNCSNYREAKIFIDKIIGQMFEIGLNVRVLMTDLDTEKLTTATDWKVCAEDPFIKINDKKIYYMYEPLSLMKNMRHNLVESNFLLNDQVIASWFYIDVTYKHDKKKKNLRIAPELSFNHFLPIKDDVNELTFASQMFSKTMATAISFYIETKTLPASAKGTQQWILTMNKLKEMLNFSTLNPPECKSAVFSGETSQIDFLKNMTHMFNEMRLVQHPQRPCLGRTTVVGEFIEGFKITINALLLLDEDLKSENCWYPLIGLSRDCLNNFFAMLFKKYHRYPTAEQMKENIKTLPIFNIFQYNTRTSNTDDMETFMTHLKEMPIVNMYEPRTSKLDFVDLCRDAVHEFDTVILPARNKLANIALYLLHKGYQKHSECELMKKFVYDRRGGSGGWNNELENLYVTKDGRIINTVPPTFLFFIKALESMFKNYLSRKEHFSMSALLQHVQRVVFKVPCQCFPLDYIKQMFLRYRLHLLIKYNNALYVSKNCKPGFFVDFL